MQPSQKRTTETIKIKFKVDQKYRNKTTTYKNLNYTQFAEKVATIFQLHHDKIYRLYYLDPDNEEIIVNGEEDYTVFIQYAHPMIFYLEQTEYPDLDFRKSLQKQINLLQEIQRLNDLVKQKEIVINKLSSELQQLKNTPSELKIQSYKVKALTDLQQFKQYLQRKSVNSIQQRVKEIKQALQSEKRRRSGNFAHKFGCQNANCKNSKRITGLRYRCLACSANLCQYCADQKISSSNLNHNPAHPVVRFRNQDWDSKFIQMREFEIGELKDKIVLLAEQMQIPKSKAQAIVAKHPQLSIEDLRAVALDQCR